MAARKLVLPVSPSKRALYVNDGDWEPLFWLDRDGPSSPGMYTVCPSQVSILLSTYGTWWRAQPDTPSTQSLPHTCPLL